MTNSEVGPRRSFGKISNDSSFIFQMVNFLRSASYMKVRGQLSRYDTHVTSNSWVIVM